MLAEPTLIATRSFARNLNLLLKTARLYGFEHERSAALFQAAWGDLRAALENAGEAGLLLGVSAAQVLLDGVPLERRATDRSFAQLLSSAGLSSVHFSFSVTPDDLSRFVRAFASPGPKTAPLAARLKATLGEKGEPTIRINEVRFVAQDSALADATVAAELAARSLGAEASELQKWLKDPQKLLQLIAAAQGSRTQPSGREESAPPSGSVPAPAEEEDVVRIIRLLCRLGEAASNPASQAKPAQFERQLSELPEPAQAAFSQALKHLAAASPSTRPDTPFLMHLAEHIAVQFALERYERGDARVNTVVELLDRMKQEVQALRTVLKAHEQKMGRAGIEVESHEEILDRQFWAALPERAKQKILLSPEAWAIPPQNVRQYIGELLGRNEAESAKSILLNYARCVQDPSFEACRKTAVGLTDLVDLYGGVDGHLVGDVIRFVGDRLTRGQDSVLQSLLCAAFVRFNHEAASRFQYPAVQQAVVSLEGVEQDQPELAHLLSPRIRVENRLDEFLEDALRAASVPEGLVEVLRRTRPAAVERLAARLIRCDRRDEYERAVNLVKELGSEAIAQLRKMLITRSPAEAVCAVGLLSRLDPETLAEHLAGCLRAWGRTYQDEAVRQLASSGASQRGRLLVNLLDVLDPVVVPGALDEIGMSGDRTAALRMLKIVEDGIEGDGDPFLPVKAIESLGRLRDSSAAPLLHRLVEAKRLLLWAYPRELRVTAAQAMAKIDSIWAKTFLPKSGLSEAELSLAPLDPVPNSPWVRQRRYERIRLPHSMRCVVSTPQGVCPMAVEGLSLGGGVGTCPLHLRPGTLSQVVFRPGLGHVRAGILVREMSPEKMSFELVKIGLGDRLKLRRPLAGYRVPAV